MQEEKGQKIALSKPLKTNYLKSPKLFTCEQSIVHL